MEQVEPRYERLHAAPLAWSASTKGEVVGEPLLTPLETSFMIGPKRLRTALDEYRKTWKGKLRGRIVLLTSPRPISNRSSPLFTRYTESGLQELFRAARERDAVSVSSQATPPRRSISRPVAWQRRSLRCRPAALAAGSR